MDDIIVYSLRFREHFYRLTEVFNCEFLRKVVAYLGYLITENGVKPKPAKFDFELYPTKNEKINKSVLGLARSYRRYISNFANIFKPLTKLKKKVTLNFGSDCMEAYSELKPAFTSSPILIYFNFENHVW